MSTVTVNKDVVTQVLELFKKKSSLTFRDLKIKLGESVGAQDVWNSLKILQQQRLIESISLSRRRKSWKLQWHVLNQAKEQQLE